MRRSSPSPSSALSGSPGDGDPPQCRLGGRGARPPSSSSETAVRSISAVICAGDEAPARSFSQGGGITAPSALPRRAKGSG